MTRGQDRQRVVAVRSSLGHFKVSGLRWLSLTLLVLMPWSGHIRMAILHHRSALHPMNG